MLVLTVIVLSILAGAVIMNISNTNIIGEANKAVSNYSASQMQQAIDFAATNILLENSGDIIGVNDPIKITKKMVELGSITEEERVTLLKNGGYHNGKYVGMEGKEIVDNTAVSVTLGDDYKIEDGNGRLVVGFRIYPKYGISIDCLDTSTNCEVGLMVLSKINFDKITDMPLEDFFTLEQKGKYKQLVVTVVPHYREKYSDGSFLVNQAIVGMLPEMADYIVFFRAYVKFDYTDENGNVIKDCIVYSPIVKTTYNEAKANTK